MKRKLIVCALIAAVGIVQVMCMGSRRVFVDYWLRCARGEYDTNIDAANAAAHNCGTATAYFDGKYYYYDKDKSAICEYHTGNPIVSVKAAPKGLAVSGQYIYYCTDSALYQCSYRGEEVFVFLFPGETWAEELHLEGTHIYCKCGEYSGISDDAGIRDVIYILDSENITGAATAQKIDDGWKEILPYDEEVIPGIEGLYVRKAGNGCLAAKGNPDLIRVSSEANGLRISNKDNGGAFELLSGSTGKEIFGTGQEIMASIDNDIYMSVFMTNEIGCLTNEKQWEVYEGGLDTELRVSRMAIDEDIWIVLLEEYAAGSAGSSPEGSVGEYLNSHIVCIDLDAKQVTDSIPVKTGQVIYMDKSQYASIRDGKVSFYSIADGKKLKEHEVKGYRMREDYHVESCGKKIFFFRNGEMIDVVDIKDW